jgi:hypothetical protein
MMGAMGFRGCRIPHADSPTSRLDDLSPGN